MATLKYDHVKISAVSACVPRAIAYNTDLGYLLPQEEIEKTISAIGIREKRITDTETCASDLCAKAAEQLFQDNKIERSSIDMVLFMSQLPDYRMPATAPILQHRLGLPKSTAAMDLSLACSGYVYALSAAMAYASIPGIDRVLLLDGDTVSKVVNKMDKVNVPLYGDAGTATLVEKTPDIIPAHFTLYSDGAGEDAVKIKAGGARYPATADNLLPYTDSKGNTRSENEVYMDGMDVFNFALSNVPKSIKEICGLAGQELSTIEHIVLHQANKFMTDFIIKRLKYPLDRVPYSLDRYGNTSSASIPLTLSSELSGRHPGNVILCGFGAGLSWGTALLSLRDCNISPVIEY